MNNKEFVAELAQQTGYSQDDTQKLVRKVIDAMITEFEDGEVVAIPNFGTFEVKKRMERVVNRLANLIARMNAEGDEDQVTRLQDPEFVQEMLKKYDL